MIVLFLFSCIFSLPAQEKKQKIFVFPIVESSLKFEKISKEEVITNYILLRKDESLYLRFLTFVYGMEMEEMEVKMLNNDYLFDYTSFFKPITSINKFTEVYVSAVKTNEMKQFMDTVLEATEVDYVMTINLYSIAVNKSYDNAIDRVEHSIHYDIYNAESDPVYGGQFFTTTKDFSSSNLNEVFSNFLRDVHYRLEILQETNDKDLFESLYQAKYTNYYNEIYGLKNSWGVGFTTALNSVYGGIGLHVLYFVSNDLELNSGMGFDFSGYKMGAGLRYFIFNNQNFNNRIFVTLNYGFNSGNTFELGGQRDENGYQLYPNDVSNHKIYFDHAVHLGTGVNFTSDFSANEKFVFQPFIGYSFSFINKDTELLSGKDVNFRNNFTEFMGSGGIHFGINITAYFKGKKKK